jgi:hypothetical protein
VKSAPAKAAAQFKEPAAIARLNKSLEGATAALSQLSSHAGRDASKGARDLYKDVKSFITNARRDSGKFAKALKSDFDAAQKKLATATSSNSASSAGGSRSRSTAAKKKPATRTAAKRSTTRTTTRKAR